ncbi:nonribosomal peptide synthetase 12 [Moniliophthora roreri MCA 2997]|uniref:Nonribosomal peptide synthetase 12 n=2 Tax=Moniliophthora roreri TaxID=221103 RepID=V2YC20_MONRO|nr:nonribosomal peptide synthetase 12 [Moniliophthora roreri MCA 2997]KAI3603066.1 nonribosomal peptide synthetase 12 [Moniliophthora roreri]
MPTASPLSHLSPVDRALFNRFGFGPSREVEIPIVHHAFERHVRQQPDAIAVEDTSRNASITYSLLDCQSNRLARRLRANGIRPGTRVCILARRSIPFVVGILAVLKSGGQYVPLDAVTITDETLQFVLQDSSPKMVLTMEEFSHRVAEAAVPTVVLEHAIYEDELSNASHDKVEDLSSPGDGVYCIYTSGTTGKPKGVDVKHEGASNVISGPPGNVGMRPGMRVAQLLNIAFDMGAWEILGSMYNGATLCLRGNTSKEWVALLKTVNIVISTPSILSRHDPEDYPNIKHVIVGGEPCSQSLADRWAEYINFNNCCGPTEISICNTVQPHTPGYPLSIGKPIPNTNVYILSYDTPEPEPLPIGEVGCMWVGGIGTGTSYLNLPERTAERWRKDPFVKGGMMFNTGDLGRWRKDGQLDHMGRVDDQVKVKGFRVELDGVGTAMRRHKEVTNAVALLIESELWGFVTPSTVDVDLVKRAAAEIQPYYAVPTRYVAVDDFPMTRNGKVDKRELTCIAQKIIRGSEPEQEPEEQTDRPAIQRKDTSSSDSSDFLPTPQDESQFAFDESECEIPSDTLSDDIAAITKNDLCDRLGAESFQGDVLKKLRIAWA